MKRLNLFLILIPAVVLLFISCQSPKTENNTNPSPFASFQIMRGTNLACWLSQSELRDPNGKHLLQNKISGLLTQLVLIMPVCQLMKYKCGMNQESGMKMLLHCLRIALNGARKQDLG